MSKAFPAPPVASTSTAPAPATGETADATPSPLTGDALRDHLLQSYVCLPTMTVKGEKSEAWAETGLQRTRLRLLRLTSQGPAAPESAPSPVVPSAAPTPAEASRPTMPRGRRSSAWSRLMHRGRSNSSSTSASSSATNSPEPSPRGPPPAYY